jgi:ribonuclease III
MNSYLDGPFSDLFAKLGYVFVEADLLIQAFTHASYVNEQPGVSLKDNERLEFLGDAVLDLAISRILMEAFEEAEEGDLSKLRAMVVDEAGLCRVALDLGLGGYVRLGKGEAQSGGREKPSILADTMEALLGALYLDAGFDKSLEIIRTLFSPVLERLMQGAVFTDFKSRLQEHTQQCLKSTPKYRLLEELGPAHDKTFRVEVTLTGRKLAEGEGKSKKEAEQNAAREALQCFTNGHDL